MATLQAQLRRFGRRVLAVGIAAGIGWGLAAAVLLVLVAAWLDLVWELPPWPRVICLGVAAICGLALMAAACWLAQRRRRPRALARRLDDASQSGGQIQSGVDLMLEEGQGNPLTAGLVLLAVERAGNLAHALPGKQAVPARPVRWSLGGLALVGLAVALLVLALPRLAHTQWLRFTDPFGDHAPYSRVVFTVEPGDVRVVYGGGLDVRVTTEGPPVDRLDLVLETTDGATESLPMFPEAGGAWRATVASVTTPGRYHVRARAGRSERYRVDVITVPKLESVRFRVALPAYTNRPPYEGPLPQGGLAGLPGTRVDVWATSNRPLAGGRLTFPVPDGSRLQTSGPAGPSTIDLAPVPGSEREVTGSFEIRAAGQMTLHVTDVDNQRSHESFTAPVALLTDERPFVRLLEPQPLSLATPDAVLPVVLAAEDDYGVARLELYRSLNDSRALPQPVAVPKVPPTHWTGRVLLPLSAYGLQAGDEIKLYARVEDNDPAGPKGSESPVAVVRIISQADFERFVRARQGLELLQSKYRRAQRELEALAEQAETLQKKIKEQKEGKEADELARQGMRDLAQAMRAEADRLRRSADAKLGYDLDEQLSKHLREMAERLERSARDADALAREPGRTAKQLAQDLERLRSQLQDQQQQAKQDTVDPLDYLGDVQPLIEDSARYVILAQRQRDLAERLKSLAGKDRPNDPKLKARLRDLQTEQQQLREQLARLLDDIEDHAARLSDRPELAELKSSAREFAEKVRDSGAAAAMADAEAGLAEFSGTRGHAAAQKAADLLEQFLGRCRGMGKSGRGALRFQPGLADCLGDTVDQLLADAGLSSGDGQGQGAAGQGGSSSRRNTLENVGLYGGLPALGETAGMNEPTNRAAAGPGVRSGPKGSSGPADPAGPGGLSPKRDMTGSTEAAVPGAYRRRVAEYFQRIADETGGK